ncbi:MAG TPA: xanthine dehydrogenase family protein molybdopterin-binding subunit, partial [Candidatus Didemnitutus sp.]|nr:xanthine dehydrogenase family protein molybdopterin-binding subunit [Candidatus Didemnitutus sp.]
MNAEHPGPIGQPVDRSDGRAKVTGSARYAAEFPADNLAHVSLVLSTVASGTIRRIDTDAARRTPGVLAVFTHENIPVWHQPPEKSDGKLGEKQLPLVSPEIHSDGEIIGLVAATSLESAQEAARLVAVEYDTAPVAVDLADATEFREPESFMGFAKLQVTRGDPDAAFARDDVVAIDETYETPFMHHHPIEPHASLAQWDGDKLTIHTSTQGVVGYREITAAVLGIPKENVQVISPFLGGGFGCKGFVWAHPFLAAMVARELGRPARLVHTRQQMFTVNGHRPRTLQRVALAAGRGGRLVGLRHEITTHTSKVDEFVPAVGAASSILYASPAAQIKHRVTELNLGTGTPARAPGEAPGTFALESAMDELARALRMDPVRLRQVNMSATNAQNGRPWSANRVAACYSRGAESFGWDATPREPGGRREGSLLIGQGMATATYPAHRNKAAAVGQWHADGRIVFASATQDIGTGTYTVMAQVAAEILSVPVERVEFKLGDTAYPAAPGSGGSRTAASVAPAVRGAALRLR